MAFLRTHRFVTGNTQIAIEWRLRSSFFPILDYSHDGPDGVVLDASISLVLLFWGPRLISTSPIPNSYSSSYPSPSSLARPPHDQANKASGKRDGFPFNSSTHRFTADTSIASQPTTPYPFCRMIRCISRPSCTSWTHATQGSTCLKI